MSRLLGPPAADLQGPRPPRPDGSCQDPRGGATRIFKVSPKNLKAEVVMDVLGEDWLDGEARWLRQRQFLCRVESGDKVEDGRAVFDGALPKLRCHVLFFQS